MSTITKKLESTQVKTSANLQRTAIDSIIPKQLPSSIINRISNFTSSNELVHTIRPVSKKYQQFSITILNFNNSQITDKELIDIVSKEKVSLTNIKISDCPNITDLSLKHLSTLKNLTTLNLSGCDQITDAGVKDLSTLQNLTTLNLSWCDKITDASIKDLSTLQNLTTLNLSWCDKITDASVKDLSTLQNLTILNLSGCDQITDASVKDLSALQYLTTLDLSRRKKITDAGIKDLSALKNLTTLSLSRCKKITDASIKDLSALKNLTTLDLSSCDQITDASIKDLSALKNLTTLNLSGCDKITDAGVKDLSALRNLTTLHLSWCDKITDVGVKDLSALRNLTTLHLSWCDKITDVGVKDLSALRNLTTLHLSWCDKITDACLEDLVKLQNLTTLELGYAVGSSPIRVKELNMIRQMIAEKTALNKFINEKSKKTGTPKCESQFKDAHAMSCTAISTGFQITINSLYLLTEKNLDSFLLQKPDDQNSVKTFLDQKKLELIEKAANDLIEWFNSNNFHKVAITDDNKLLAKELLIMHATGKLSATKRFLITHEMGHAHDHDRTKKSLGDFNPHELDFIKPHQFSEVRADLTAAREENAHELGMAYFEWRSIIAGQPDESNSHPTDKNRAKAIKIDHDKILKATSISTA